MGRLLLLASVAVLAGIANPAHAQFCPGVSPWVFKTNAANTLNASTDDWNTGWAMVTN